MREEEKTMAENDEKAAEAAPKKDGRPVITRRALCVGLGGTAALVGLGAVRYAGSAPLVRPPGGQDEDALVSACIRCEKCYEVCPRGVIAPAHLEDGLLNMRTPVMDFSANWCDWCTEENGGEPLCVASCPTEALKAGKHPRDRRAGPGRAEPGPVSGLPPHRLPLLLRRLRVRGHGAGREQPPLRARTTRATAAAPARACASRCRTAPFPPGPPSAPSSSVPSKP